MQQMIETKNYVVLVADLIDDVPVMLEQFFDDRSVPSDERVYLSSGSRVQCKKVYDQRMAFFMALKKPEARKSWATDDYRAVPFFIEYSPVNSNIAFFPGLDDHSGNGPQELDVQTNHTLVLGTLDPLGRESIFTDQHEKNRATVAIPELNTIYPNYVQAWNSFDTIPNGDWIVSLPDRKLIRIPMAAEIEQVLPSLSRE